MTGDFVTAMFAEKPIPRHFDRETAEQCADILTGLECKSHTLSSATMTSVGARQGHRRASSQRHQRPAQHLRAHRARKGRKKAGVEDPLADRQSPNSQFPHPFAMCPTSPSSSSAMARTMPTTCFGNRALGPPPCSAATATGGQVRLPLSARSSWPPLGRKGR